jgi:hypothetical protein
MPLFGLSRRNLHRDVSYAVKLRHRHGSTFPFIFNHIPLRTT